MADYAKMYKILFNACTDATAALARGEIARADYLLKRAQLQTEAVYVSEKPAIQIRNDKKK